MGIRENVIRVAVVDDGIPLSGIWRIWRRKDDLYVAPRSVAGNFKISLHASGRFRFGFTSDETARKFRKEGDDRAVFKWERPQVNSKIAILLQIIFPASCLLAPKGEPKLHKDLVRLVIPKSGNATVVSLIETMLEPDVTEIESSNFQLRTLARWEMPTGRQMWVVEHEETSSLEFLTELENFRDSLPVIMGKDPKMRLPDAETSHLRALLALDPNGGTIRFVDVDAEHVRSSSSEESLS
jgi:hypothetical protein